MALVKCPTCKKDVSTHAEKCPTCGTVKEWILRSIETEEETRARLAEQGVRFLNCPDCGVEVVVSEETEFCPNCGCVSDIMLESVETEEETKTRRELESMKGATSTGPIFYNTIDYDGGPIVPKNFFGLY